MAKKLFEGLKIHCLVCTSHIGFLGPKNAKSVFVCKKCKSRFEIDGGATDWRVGGESSKGGLAITMHLSAVVENRLDSEKIREYYTGEARELKNFNRE